jgi:DUF4097 and DUF4098 domain-containing protein YvlB
VYAKGLTEEDLVNSQEISLQAITDIALVYRWEKVILRQNDGDTLILKEYMNRNDPRYYAHIVPHGNTLTIERGKRPLGILINTFDVRAEVYIPASYRNAITVKTTSGGIESAGQLVGGTIHIKSSSGAIKLERVAAEELSIQSSSGAVRSEWLQGAITIRTSSGSITSAWAGGTVDLRTESGKIRVDHITGNVSAKTSSGAIDFALVTGDISAKTISGGIRCGAGEDTEHLSLTTTSGIVSLGIPRNSNAAFSARTTSGSLSTPFPDQLFSPLSDRKSVQGNIGSDNPEKEIRIQTTSGSIHVNWLDG